MHHFIAKTRFRYILACLLLTSFPGSAAWAALPAAYDVELVIFINQYPDDDGEQWHRTGTGSGMAEPPGFLPEDYFTELSADSYTIQNINHALERSSRYSVLFHRAWRQLAYDKAHAIAYPVHSPAGDGRGYVEGVIKLVRERFLHMDVDVHLIPAGKDAEVLGPDLPDSQPAFELREKRRIKSNVLYYFDHPRFGMIAKVTPYIPPETEILDKEAPLQQTTEESPADEAVLNQPNPADDQLTR